MLEHAAATHVGLERSHNEDAWRIVPLPAGLGLAVADGMGSHATGEVASQLAIEQVATALAALPPNGSALPHLQQAVDAAHEAIRGAARGGREGMGCTLVVAVLRAGQLEYLNIGDSRAYLLRDGQLRQLTDDDSLVGEMVRHRLITADEAKVHALRSVLTKALGVTDAALATVASLALEPADIVLLCSDGLTGMVTDAAIATTLAAAGSLQEAADQLVVLANEAGGKDNITVVLARQTAADAAAR
ncbi:MAG: serine/threonine-protein phosphatase [Fimbriimonadaceae bacterium]|nr:serine/threonine-protein phosphatase [Fimbriimonadaceae bacterium]